MAVKWSTREMDEQRDGEIAKWKAVTQQELQELLALIDAGIPNAEGSDRKLYHATVDRFIRAARELRALVKT